MGQRKSSPTLHNRIFGIQFTTMKNIEQMTDEELEKEYWATASAAKILSQQELRHSAILIEKNRRVIKKYEDNLPK